MNVVQRIGGIKVLHSCEENGRYTVEVIEYRGIISLRNLGFEIVHEESNIYSVVDPHNAP